MSRRGQNGHRADEALDDATVEDLLAGRYDGDAPDLVAVSELLGQIRSFAEQPPPLPSASLDHILSASAPASEGGLRTTSPRLRGRRVGPFGRRAQGPEHEAGPRLGARPRYRPTVAAALFVVLAAVVVAAGSARLLPGAAQDVVAKIVQTVTPFDFPEQREPEAVSSKAPRPEPAPRSEEPTARAPGDSSQPGTGEQATDGGHSIGRDGAGSPSGPNGLNAAPTPATTVAETDGRSSDGVTSSVPPPPPKSKGFSADLVGATGAQMAADPDGHGTATINAHPGRDELCLTLVVSGIAPITAVHLHAESSGGSGPVIAAWTEPTPGASSGCVAVTDQLVKQLRKQPRKYHVDVHTTEFPDGALRGPLTR